MSFVISRSLLIPMFEKADASSKVRAAFSLIGTVSFSDMNHFLSEAKIAILRCDVIKWGRPDGRIETNGIPDWAYGKRSISPGLYLLGRRDRWIICHDSKHNAYGNDLYGIYKWSDVYDSNAIGGLRLWDDKATEDLLSS